MSQSGRSGGKKPMKKNAFLLFCDEKARQLEAQGQTFPTGLQDRIAAGSPYWEKMTPEERAPYQDRSKMLREHPELARNLPRARVAVHEPAKQKFQSTTQKLREVQQIRAEDITEIADSLVAFVREEEYEDPAPENRNFLVIHFGTYVAADELIVPAEYCVAKFSLLEGLTECYSELLDPGQIPTGYFDEAMMQIKRCGYPWPGPEKDFRKLQQCSDDIIQLMTQNQPLGTDGEPKGALGLYTLSDYIDDTNGCLKLMIEYYSEGVSVQYKVKNLMDLFTIIMNQTCPLGEGALPEVPQPPGRCQAINLFQNSVCKYGDEVACDHHAEDEVGVGQMRRCSMHLVKTWIYTILEHICPLYGISQIPGQHCPIVREKVRKVVVSADEEGRETESKKKSNTFVTTVSAEPIISPGPGVAAVAGGRSKTIPTLHTGSFFAAQGSGRGRGRGQWKNNAQEAKLANLPGLEKMNMEEKPKTEKIQEKNLEPDDGEKHKESVTPQSALGAGSVTAGGHKIGNVGAGEDKLVVGQGQGTGHGPGKILGMKDKQQLNGQGGRYRGLQPNPCGPGEPPSTSTCSGSSVPKDICKVKSLQFDSDSSPNRRANGRDIAVSPASANPHISNLERWAEDIENEDRTPQRADAESPGPDGKNGLEHDLWGARPRFNTAAMNGTCKPGAGRGRGTPWKSWQK